MNRHTFGALSPGIERFRLVNGLGIKVREYWSASGRPTTVFRVRGGESLHHVPDAATFYSSEQSSRRGGSRAFGAVGSRPHGLLRARSKILIQHTLSMFPQRSALFQEICQHRLPRRCRYWTCGRGPAVLLPWRREQQEEGVHVGKDHRVESARLLGAEEPPLGIQARVEGAQCRAGIVVECTRFSRRGLRRGCGPCSP